MYDQRACNNLGPRSYLQGQGHYTHSQNKYPCPILINFYVGYKKRLLSTQIHQFKSILNKQYGPYACFGYSILISDSKPNEVYLEIECDTQITQSQAEARRESTSLAGLYKFRIIIFSTVTQSLLLQVQTWNENLHSGSFAFSNWWRRRDLTSRLSTSN